MKAWGVVCAILLAAAPHAPLSVTALDGAPMEVSRSPDERALLIHFWASWCPDCAAELPALDRAASHCAGSGVRVLLVNVGETADEARRFTAEHAIRGTVVLDPKGALWRHEAPAGLPANLTWTQDGVRTEVGPRDEAAWARAFSALGCEPATSDPSAALPAPDDASPGGTAAPEIRSGS